MHSTIEAQLPQKVTKQKTCQAPRKIQSIVIDTSEINNYRPISLLYIQLFQLRLSTSKAESRIRARKAAGNRLQINEFSKRFPAAFRARIRLSAFLVDNLN
jgi:hypothetical protein